MGDGPDPVSDPRPTLFALRPYSGMFRPRRTLSRAQICVDPYFPTVAYSSILLLSGGRGRGRTEKPLVETDAGTPVTDGTGGREEGPCPSPRGRRWR